MSTALVWFRRDLRCNDNPALTTAVNNHDSVIPVFIADKDPLQTVGAAQCWWLHHSLNSLAKDLNAAGMRLSLKHGDVREHLMDLIRAHDIAAVYWNRCYEPASIERDTHIKAALEKQGLMVETFNASLLNEPWTVLNQQKKYFSVFTPYWKQAARQISIPPIWPLQPSHTPHLSSDNLNDWKLLPSKPDWAKKFSTYWTPGEAGAQDKLAAFMENNLHDYQNRRDIPAFMHTSRLSPHLHFGEISPIQIYRALEKDASWRTASAEHFSRELGWREFAAYLLYHIPDISTVNVRKAFDNFAWESDEEGLLAWKKGLTGYPIVDAGMRELWHTGFMHNRVRMIAASFLVKDLQIDWRAGASWFLDTLLDADLANNSVGWQWVAGSGVDASPWFRIFNPVLQGEKFDPQGDYVRTWVPELNDIDAKWIHKPWEAPDDIKSAITMKNYPPPLVNHAVARDIALEKYKYIK